MSGSSQLSEHLLIVEDTQGRRTIPLVNSSYLIGRDRNCDIHLASLFVSRQHALLQRQVNTNGQSVYLITDGDRDGNPSVNGLMINGQKQSQHRLKHGDHVVFAPQVWATYQFRMHGSNSDALCADPHSEDPFDITLIDPAMMSGDTEGLPSEADS